ncbi:MAG: hypothetical protein E6845_03200 [Clostridium sp.]|uniref:hypothetical protein n=1 Tax=Clostridium sp. TaxID=1506 RepID=UPI0029003869|nr:hypothetical protein [Clostridium sp.]MDU1601944.1 hypothetical protein [Clostridium sp.]
MLNPYDYYITPEEYEIAKANGICRATLEDRIRRLAWDKEQAISMAPRKQRRIDKRFIKIAKENGICYSTLKYRINIINLDPEVAATKKLQDYKERAKIMSERNRKYPAEYRELARKNGISERAFYHRLKSGWSIEDAATIPLMTRSQIGKMTKEKNKTYIDRLFLNRKKNVNI